MGPMISYLNSCFKPSSNNRDGKKYNGDSSLLRYTKEP